MKYHMSNCSNNFVTTQVRENFPHLLKDTTRFWGPYQNPKLHMQTNFPKLQPIKNKNKNTL